MGEKPKRWKKGDVFSARHLNQVIDLARAGLPMSADGAEVFSGEDGSTIMVPERIWAYDIRIGVVVDAGPAAEADFSDARYWVKPQFIVIGLGGDLVVLQDDPPSNADGEDVEPYPVTCTNIAELAVSTHSLQKDGTLPVLMIGFIDDSGAKRWVMNQQAAGATAAGGIFKIQANATGANVYTGGLVTPKTTDINSATDLALASFGTDPPGGTLHILLDLGHLGYSGHSLDVGSYQPASYWKTNSTGKQVWLCGFAPGTPGSDYNVFQWLSGKLISSTVKLA